MRFDNPFRQTRKTSESCRSPVQPVISVYSVRSDCTDSVGKPEIAPRKSPLQNCRKISWTTGKKSNSNTQSQEEKICEIPFGSVKGSHTSLKNQSSQGNKGRKEIDQKKLPRKQNGIIVLPSTKRNSKKLAKQSSRGIFRKQDNRGQEIPKTISCCTTEDSENPKEAQVTIRGMVPFGNDSLSDGSICETTVDGQDPPSISSSFSGSDSGYSKDVSKDVKRYSSDTFIESIFYAADEFFGMHESEDR